MLRIANLSSTCLDNPDTLIPAICGGPFRELVARKTGCPHISLEACQHLEVENLSFGQALLMEPTVAAALHTFCRLVVSDTSNAYWRLHPRPGGDLWFETRIQTFATSGQWHLTLYILSWMLKIAQLADPAWSPSEILIGSKGTSERFEAIEMLGSTALFQQNCTGFLIPASVLALPTRKSAAKGEVRDANFWSTAPAETYSASLRQIIESYSNEGWLSINQVSEVIDTSVRTIQRRLSTEQETYSTVIQQCRAELAGDLLENTNAPILEIANQLGYKNQSHFTRAFHRWAKLSPSQFRQQRRRSL